MRPFLWHVINTKIKGLSIMKSQVEEYCRMAEDIDRKIKIALDNMDVIARESERVATIDISSSWKEAELEFEKMTGLGMIIQLKMLLKNPIKTINSLMPTGTMENLQKVIKIGRISYSVNHRMIL